MGTGQSNDARMLALKSAPQIAAKVGNPAGLLCRRIWYSVGKSAVLGIMGYRQGRPLLTPVEHHPYLGLELDNKLCWKQQLANVRSKGTRTLNMVRRNFTKGTKSDTRNQIYTSLVCPVLEHGSLVWDLYQQVRIWQIEAVQNKAARYVHQDWQRTSSVTAMEEALGWLPLQNRRLVNRLTFIHKTIHPWTTWVYATTLCKPANTTE